MLRLSVSTDGVEDSAGDWVTDVLLSGLSQIETLFYSTACLLNLCDKINLT